MDKPTMPMPQVSKEPADVKKEEAGIEVVALREGFFDCRRIKEGDVFMIENMNRLGSWMKLTDPKAEAARQARKKSGK